MARNAVNKEMTARAVRNRVFELRQLGMRTENLMQIVAFEFFVQETTIYKYLQKENNTAFDAEIQAKESDINSIWNGIKTLSKQNR
jgi:hypothetical protein